MHHSHQLAVSGLSHYGVPISDDESKRIRGAYVSLRILFVFVLYILSSVLILINWILPTTHKVFRNVVVVDNLRRATSVLKCLPRELLAVRLETACTTWTWATDILKSAKCLRPLPTSKILWRWANSCWVLLTRVDFASAKPSTSRITGEVWNSNWWLCHRACDCLYSGQYLRPWLFHAIWCLPS